MITYKLFNQKKDGKLYPLYVNANKPTEIGKWLRAEEGPMTEDGKVKAKKLGKLAFRPGWHSGNLPVALHIGDKANPKDVKPSYRPDNQVWAECEVHTDVDYTPDVDRHGLKKIPINGGYWFKTNLNMYGKWYISGELKVNRILSDAEVYEINKKYGIQDLPRKKTN